MDSITIHPGAESLIRSLGLNRVEDAWRSDLPGVIVNDRGDRQVLRLTPPDGSKSIYLKRWSFPEGNLHRRIPGKREMRERARKEYENLLRLSEAGIRAPNPLALGESPGFGGPIATFLILEELSGFRESAQLDLDSIAVLHKVVRGAARTLSQLHRLGLFWRSPGLKHFYVDDAMENFALIDVPRLEQKASAGMVWILRLFGGDPPCRERDLSKLLAEILERQPDSRQWIREFWEGCAESGLEEPISEAWQEKVLALAGRRLAARRRR